ncbi:urease accessory protein UreE [Roseibium algae]|uniref:Urease accessory protein UreE n=1 Tax=Roseibium algae TaxID=3123038 RepID=A0ABU8TMY8_9HYPH
MIRVSEILPAGTWDGPPTDQITLDREDRHRRRAAMTGEGGLAFLLDQPAAIHLRHGDGLKLEDGSIIEVIAAPEELAEIEADNMGHLVKIAWHLGNRHLPTQLMGTTLRIRRDHVIEDLVIRLGGKLTILQAPFDPEGGAYGHGQTHGHDHGNGEQSHQHSHHDGHSHDH